MQCQMHIKYNAMKCNENAIRLVYFHIAIKEYAAKRCSELIRKIQNKKFKFCNKKKKLKHFKKKKRKKVLNRPNNKM